MYAVSSRWPSAIGSSHLTACRVDVWQNGAFVESVRPLDGSVTDTWQIGQRRQLSMSFSPELSDLIVPGVELRPYSGITYGAGAPELVPHGVFPVQARDLSLVPSALQVSCGDSWLYVSATSFLRPIKATVGMTVANQIAKLINETGQLPQAVVTAGSAATMTAQVFTGDRSEAINGLCKVIGAEAGIGRDGVPFVRNRPALGTAVVDLVGGNYGRLLNCTESVDISRMYNVVSVSSSNADPLQRPNTLLVRITDPTHPAYPRPGVPLRVYPLEGPHYTTTATMTVAGRKQLSKVAGVVRSYSAECIADPALDASDTVNIDYNGLVRAQIATITHPFTVGNQLLTTATGREDDA